MGYIDNFYRQLRLPWLLDRPNHHIGDCTGRIRPYLVDKRKNQKAMSKNRQIKQTPK
ncbi:MAG: hypothetical protein K2L31_07050 [Muribaculum sp.]|nr:hypothetical protein [Muribaculum sp.]